MLLNKYRKKLTQLAHSENLKHHSINDEIIRSAFMIFHFQCEGKITVLYCQAELDMQAFPNGVWERETLSLNCGNWDNYVNCGSDISH